MAQTTVLLREDVDNLGARGEIVKVRAGYARNYLLPRKLAVEATTGNVRQIEAERGALMKKEARERVSAEGQAALMGALRLDFERKVGEHGILYGSVTSMDIAEALKQKGFSVAVRLHRDVTVEIPVVVTGEGGAQTAAAAAAASAEGEAASEASAAGASDAAPGEAGETAPVE
jgi:large subunit ribosomal protein L9